MNKRYLSMTAVFTAAALLFAPLSGIEAQAAPAAAAQAAYVSELTGLPTSIALQTQRPVAVMIDNDTKALPHYGLSEADVVYEMMNSTANKRVTRLMAIYKDWQNGRSDRQCPFHKTDEYFACFGMECNSDS